MKLAIKLIVLCILVISIALNIYMLKTISGGYVKNQIPKWSQEEYDLIGLGHEAILKAGHNTIGLYPYELQTGDRGYTIRFQALSHLQLLVWPNRSPIIWDGCVYYHFSEKMDLIDYTTCG